jgi:hypothetical protein
MPVDTLPPVDSADTVRVRLMRSTRSRSSCSTMIHARREESAAKLMLLPIRVRSARLGQ